MLDLDFEFGFNFPAWHNDAACAEHEARADAWFPERGESCEPAKAVCRACLVQRECLGWALDEGPKLEGVWGGTSQKQRQALLDSGRVTGDLVRRWGANAMHGRELERDDEITALRWGWLTEQLAG